LATPQPTGYSTYDIPQLINAAQGSARTEQSNNPSMNPFFSALGLAQSVPSSEYIASYDYSPAMANIASLASEDAETARNDSANIKRKAFIEAGAPDIAQEYGADDNTIEAARQNPFSTLALIRREAAKRNTDLNEALNSQNLFFSSTREKELGNQAFGRAQAESNFGSKLREVIGGANRGVLMAEAQDRANHPPLPAAGPAGTPPASPPTVGGPGVGTVPHMGLAAALGAGRGGDVVRGTDAGSMSLLDVQDPNLLADLARRRLGY
jgi:hypothetical protein